MLLRIEGGFELPLLTEDLANGPCLAKHTSLESGR